MIVEEFMSQCSCWSKNFSGKTIKKRGTDPKTKRKYIREICPKCGRVVGDELI